MSAFAVSAGSQPAIDLWCDGCCKRERFFVDDGTTARQVAARQGWTRSPGFDLCPNCSPGANSDA